MRQMYHRRSLLCMLQSTAVEVLHETDVPSSQVTVHTTVHGCIGVT